jgi:hypothetical protein
MRFVLPIIAATMLAPVSAHAGERVGDAALGALSGAVVFGPVGLVAGAVIGYSAGPSIAQSWRNNRHHPRRVVRTKSPTRVAAKPRGPSSAPEAGSVSPAAKGVGGPPAQGLE